jgi:hypothetical protein
MSKTAVAALGFGLVALGVAATPAARDELHWRWAAHGDAKSGYASYVQAWPGGRHAPEARARFDAHSWAEAAAVNTIDAFTRYLHAHPDGGHAAAARDGIDALQWQQATAGHSIASYQRYSTSQPRGKFAPEAAAKSAALRADLGLYDAALRAGTAASLETFLAQYPGHVKETEAKVALAELVEGRDIVDLLREKKIEVEAEGSGIESVSVRLRRLVPQALTVRIPVGTFFVSANPDAQNMVTTEAASVALTTTDWTPMSVSAACANRPRDIPGEGDTFSVQRSPRQAELARLMPALAAAGVDSETRQAAVWIITDDADYDDLGILVVSQFGFGGSRVINELEAARALQICDEAGIDITRKAIWRDRRRIASGLDQSDLRTWLQQKR